jgi:hypothetical protein
VRENKLSQVDVVRIIKCPGHGCSVEATADICEVDTRTVQRLLEKSGKRAADFHRLQLENLDEPLEAVQMDGLHGKTVKGRHNSQLVDVPKKLRKRLSKKRQDVASYCSGREKRISARVYPRPAHSRNSLSIDRFGGGVL